MPPSSPLRAWWARRSPAAGAAVMATGVLAVGFRSAGYGVLARIALAATSAAWLALAAHFTVRLLRERERWAAEAATPGALTAVAATTVLGTGFSVLGQQTVAAALLALSVVLWPGLLFSVVLHWRRRMTGSVFLACVATEGLAVLAATLAGAEATAWLAQAALVLLWLGLLLYCAALYCFDPRQVTKGAGDQWVAGGALSISALAGSRLLAAGSARLYLWNDDDGGVLRSVTVGLVVLDLCWYVVLVVAECVRRRPHYDEHRWSTAFPMGMTATALLSVAATLDVPWLKGPGQALLWIAVAVWLAVAAGAVRAAGAAVRAEVTSTAPR
ncbi:tellurite resistance/C4-dicarboxylate transporter family protein [Streptomyces griseus]|uniref:tellurite resistance/C4-dicarboxylate transporter family protein n=1 Tax=Streptomyces griseus TaxID=1911 RepID=UPI00055E07F5|nr:tellurite resistance/C4-dicarboxylate transporter family protein [Streptomyces griseus]